LKAARRKLPDHLALALVTRHDEAKLKKDVVIQRNEVDAAIECVRRVVGWCQVVGINTLTVYDSGGQLSDVPKSLVHLLTFYCRHTEDPSYDNISYIELFRRSH
jgi:hypothetical protein